MNSKKMKYAPRAIFDQILEYAVIPTFDLIFFDNDLVIIILRRKIPPYKYQWALPGLRMMKRETIEDTLDRLAESEIEVVINPRNCTLVGKYVGKFKTEFRRLDISTCYAIPASFGEVTINKKYFSGYRFISAIEDIPGNMGAMYKYYLKLYFETLNDAKGTNKYLNHGGEKK